MTRTETDSHWIYGIHPVNEALKRALPAYELWVDQRRRDDRIQTIIEQAGLRSLTVQKVSKDRFDAHFPSDCHQGVALRIEMPTVGTESALWDRLEQLPTGHVPLLLLLDGVVDPRNLGACLRSAEAAGVDGVVIPKHQSAPINATVCKAASGGAEWVPLFQVTNLSQTIQSLKKRDFWIIGADAQAETPLYGADLSGPVALVLGGEGKGIRRLTRERCDQLAHIPLQGMVSSLNVSVATGIFLFEAIRQRQYSKSFKPGKATT